MQKGNLQKHRGSALLLVFLLGIMFVFSLPEVTRAHQNIQKSESTESLISKPVLDSIDEHSWSFPLGIIRSDFQWASKDSRVRETNYPITVVLDLDPFGTPHGPIYIDKNSDFETQGWPGEGSVEQPYIISGLNINSTSIGEPAINITNTDVHFFIKDCWLTAYQATVIEFNSVSHGRLKNNTILESERGVVALHSEDLTIFDNLFYHFEWAGVYMEDCSLSTLRNNNCTVCYIGLHVEQSDHVQVEDNYCYSCIGGIELYLGCEYVTVFNNTAIGNNKGIVLYLDCSNNLIEYNNCTQNYFSGIQSEECQDNEILNNYGRLNVVDIYLENCTSYSISGNDCGYSPGGPDAFGAISLVNSNDSIIANNVVSYAPISIDMRLGSSFNEVSGNNCSIYDGGIVSWNYAHHNLIINNVCDGQGYGLVDIYIEVSAYNTITLNKCNLSTINIAAFGSNNTDVLENMCFETTDISIVIEDCHFSSIEGNTLRHGYSSIQLFSASFVLVKDNAITNFTSSFGIRLEETVHTSIQGNHITECSSGIYVTQSSDCNITDNTCIDTFNGIEVIGLSSNILIESNYIHLSTKYGIGFEDSTDCVVSNNKCTNASTGILGAALGIFNSQVDISWNDFSFSEIGIDFVSGAGEITHNTISSNSLRGIHLHGASVNVTWNILIDNGENARDDSPSSYFDFNYWSNYTGIDSNEDGFGDTWHPIDGVANNNDTHPLVYNPTLPEWVEHPTNQEAEYAQDFSYALGTTAPVEYAPIVDWWISDSTYFQIIDGTITNRLELDLKEYPLEVHAVNLYGFKLKGDFSVIVVDTVAPTIAGPDDFSFVYGTTGHILNWTFFDEGPSSYRVLIDGIVRFSGEWLTNGQVYDLHLDHLNLDIGDHAIEVIITDIGGNTASDIVSVTLLEPPSDMTILFIAIGASGVIIAVVVVIYIIRKKGE